MTKKPTILFDFDGVIANTEPLYDVYIDGLGVKYNLGINNLAEKVKGVPTVEIIAKYFGHLDAKLIQEVEDNLADFEITMDIPPIAGALEFIHYLKQNGYKIGLVTSSQLVKMERALKILKLENSFDSLVTADRITKGKPDPMCFLLAAKDMDASPENCIVFEDSLHGINAGLSAKMKVIGLTTSFTEEQIKDMVYATIPDFSNLEKVISLIK